MIWPFFPISGAFRGLFAIKIRQIATPYQSQAPLGLALIWRTPRGFEVSSLLY